MLPVFIRSLQQVQSNILISTHSHDGSNNYELILYQEGGWAYFCLSPPEIPPKICLFC